MSDLYLASSEQLDRVTQTLPRVKHVVMVAHNPGLSELLWKHASQSGPLSPASGFQLTWGVEDWLLTGVEAPCAVHQFSDSGGSTF